MTPLLAAAAAPKAYWYLTRATGVVSLVLLTAAVALGISNLRRAPAPAVPRFVVQSIHRSVSLLAVAFVVVHVVTTLLDGFAPIRVVDAVIPFVGVYRPLWLGLGAVAFDLLLALVVSSLLRRRLGHRLWRATHWAAYLSWPVALVHGLGTGSDAAHTWMLLIDAGCLLTVLVAIAARLADGWPSHAGLRTGAGIASAAVPLGLIVWLPGGPLASGWAQRAGTPASVLAKFAAPHGTAVAGGPSVAPGATVRGFTAPVSGTVAQGRDTAGLAVIDLHLHVQGQALSALRIRIVGEPAGGGVQMTGSEVWFGSAADPGRYTGTVTALEGTSIAATVGATPVRPLRLALTLQIDPAAGSAAGTVTVQPG